MSVGEVNVCTHLIRALEQRLPNLKLIVSTTTTTGMEDLRRKLPSHIGKIYYPIDRRGWVTKALTAIRPEAVVLVESVWNGFTALAFSAEQAETEEAARGEQPARTTLWRFAGVDLTRIDGISAGAAPGVLTDIGPQRDAFPSEDHFVSWLRLCPRTPLSGASL